MLWLISSSNKLLAWLIYAVLCSSLLYWFLLSLILKHATGQTHAKMPASLSNSAWRYGAIPASTYVIFHQNPEGPLCPPSRPFDASSSLLGLDITLCLCWPFVFTFSVNSPFTVFSDCFFLDLEAGFPECPCWDDRCVPSCATESSFLQF